jgi:hypothetical protein
MRSSDGERGAGAVALGPGFRPVLAAQAQVLAQPHRAPTVGKRKSATAARLSLLRAIAASARRATRWL